MFLRAALHKQWENTHTVSQYAVHSDPNILHREQMEDTYFFEESADKTSIVFGVLDGHNGRSVVQFITQKLPSLLLSNLAQLQSSSFESSVEEIITSTFLQLDDMTKIEVGKKADQTGTTCSLCVLRIENKEKVLYTANIGDTSAHLYDDSESISTDLHSLELTSTHRANSDEEKQRVKDAGSYVSMGRIEGKLEVFRAFGDFIMKQKGLIALPSIKRVVLKSTAAANAAYNVIMACDGLWDFVKKEQVDAIVKESSSSSNAIARDLTALAKASKSTDNITVMAVQIIA